MSSAQTHLALVLDSPEKPLSLQTLPIPEPLPGSAVIRVLATAVSPLIEKILTQAFGIPIHTPPFIPSAAAVGRIHSLGPDATTLQPGQLVFYGFQIHARDDPDTSILQGYIGTPTPAGTRLMSAAAGWSSGTFAEYARVPLENVYKLNEITLVKELGYSFADLASELNGACINAGGLLGNGGLDVHAGDSVIVAPATGHFGGAAVGLALALGCRVVAAGRNQDTLTRMVGAFRSPLFHPVRLTGDVAKDTAALKEASGTPRGADGYLDWSPPQAASSNHIQACLAALRPGGSMVLMGGIPGKVEIPYFQIMLNGLRIQGRYMFERDDAERVIRLVESGVFKLSEASGVKVSGGFKLKDVQSAFDTAAAHPGWGHAVVLEP